MRILQISSARHFGGGERHFVDLTNGLARNSHDVFVAAANDSPFFSELQISDSRILRLPFRKPFDLASAWTLRRFALEHQVEIIHAHIARDYPVAALAAQRSGPRLVLTRHVMFPMGSLHRLTRRRVARVIAVSEAVASALRTQNIFDETQISVVRNGIDLSRFPRRERQSSAAMRVGMLGELSPVKGQQEFVRAAAIVAAQHPDVEFVIAGRDNSSGGLYGRDLNQLIDSAELNNRVRVIESTVDVADYLAHLDVFVSASNSEAFGLAIVEAMAAGVPVIATKTAGAREIITDGQTGRLVSIGDAGEMARAVNELLADPDLRERFAARARAMIAEQFSVDRMTVETEAVYRAVLG